MSVADRIAGVIVGKRRLVLACMLVLTLAIGSGVGAIESSSSIDSIATDSTAVEKNDYVRANFSAREGNTTTAIFTVRNREGNVLSRASLLRTLRFQRALRSNGSVNETLVAERPTVGVANVVARTALAAEERDRETTGSGSGRATVRSVSPSIDAQIAQLESMTEAEVARLVGRLLSEDSTLPGSQAARAMLPQNYEAESTKAHARQVVVTYRTEKQIREPGSISEPVVEGHVAARHVANSQSGPETYLAFGAGFIPKQLSDAIGDSFAIVGPLAFVFVLVALAIAYRDLLDVALGLVGVLLVLLWTFGLMGWAEIPFNQVMIAVPILLIGLSVDYALHTIMRYRERRERDDVGVAEAMADSLGGVGTALTLVTVTTAVGFLSNLTSPVGDMQDFGVLTALGIVSALVTFGVVVPALKVEIGGFLTARGFDRQKRAFASSGRLGSVLAAGSSLARRAPFVVLALALLLSAAGAYGATGIDSSFSEESVMADDSAGWIEHLPESRQPGEFYLRDNREYLFSNFQTPRKQVHVLVEGNVTRPDTLERIARVRSSVGQANVTYRRDGAPVVDTPLSAMERVAQRNDSFNATFHAADTDGDGIPDENLEGVYDGFYGASPEVADQYIHRKSGEYLALRAEIAVVGSADPSTIHEEMDVVAADVVAPDAESADGDTTQTGAAGELTATATGQPIVSKQSDELLATAVVEGLAITLVALLTLLAVAFRLSDGSATLGALTLVPVVCSVLWLLGTMALLDIPFTFVTSVVGSVALGLGVDYAIHVSERFAQEFDVTGDAASAIERTVRGTGGALLSSAATTTAGFGVLAFSLLPALQRFGLILALGVVYSFLASVFVLPSLLALWVRYQREPTATDLETPVAAGDD